MTTFNHEQDLTNVTALEDEVRTATNAKALLLMARMNALPFSAPVHHKMWDNMNRELEVLYFHHRPELYPETVHLIEMGDY